MNGELMLRCDICGEMKPQDQIVAQFDENWDIYYICRDCILKMFRGDKK